jgi:uncharacterized protein (TIGR00369 family)
VTKNREQEIPYDETIAKEFMKDANAGGGLQSFLGIQIVAAEPGTMRGQLEARPELLTPFGNMHGGVLSALCDHMLGCVCYPAMIKGQWAATTEFKINLTAPVSKGMVDATATIVKITRTQAVVRIDITNDGRTAAIAQGTVTIRDPRKTS